MTYEHERKYWVDTEAFKAFVNSMQTPREVWPRVEITQGYVASTGPNTVRVRICKSMQTNRRTGYLTFKGPSVAGVCPEVDFRIPLKKALDVMKLCDGHIITKTRYSLDVKYPGVIFFVDIFHGDNEGLTILEIERICSTSKSPGDETSLEIIGMTAMHVYPWINIDVTEDPRFRNSNLAISPFSGWSDDV